MSNGGGRWVVEVVVWVVMSDGCWIVGGVVSLELIEML